MLLRGEGQKVGDGDQRLHLRLQLGVCCEVTLELPALVLGEDAQSVGGLEVVETVARGPAPLVAHPGTAIPRESKYSRIFFKPSLIRPFTVPSGRSKRSAIST